MSFFKYVISKDGRRQLFRVALAYAAIIAVLWGLLWWYTDHGEQVSVPDLKGMSLEQAITTLGGKNLEYLVIDSIYDEEAIAGNIIDQSPVPDSKVKEGRKIFLTVYRHLPPMERINIKEGEFAQVAIIKLKNKGIKYELRNIPNNSMVGSVLHITYKGKRLNPDDMIPRGEKVILSIGIADNASIQLPNLSGLNYYEAMALLDSLNLMGQGIFEPEAITAQDSSNYRVCRQNPAFDPDAPPIEPGRIIDFWLYNGPCTTGEDQQVQP